MLKRLQLLKPTRNLSVLQALLLINGKIYIKELLSMLMENVIVLIDVSLPYQ
jgi:hypothetical protein